MKIDVASFMNFFVLRKMSRPPYSYDYIGRDRNYNVFYDSSHDEYDQYWRNEHEFIHYLPRDDSTNLGPFWDYGDVQEIKKKPFKLSLKKLLLVGLAAKTYMNRHEGLSDHNILMASLGVYIFFDFHKPLFNVTNIALSLSLGGYLFFKK